MRTCLADRGQKPVADVKGCVARIRRLHSRILSRGRLDTRDAIEIGRLLSLIKKGMHDRGERRFKAWCSEEGNLGFVYRQAKRYMALHRYAASQGDKLSPGKVEEMPLCEAYAKAGILRFNTDQGSRSNDLAGLLGLDQIEVEAMAAGAGAFPKFTIEWGVGRIRVRAKGAVSFPGAFAALTSDAANVQRMNKELASKRRLEVVIEADQ